MKKIDRSVNKVHMVKPFDADYVASVLADIWARENGYNNVTFKFTPKEDSETSAPTDTER